MESLGIEVASYVYEQRAARVFSSSLPSEPHKDFDAVLACSHLQGNESGAALNTSKLPSEQAASMKKKVIVKFIYDMCKTPADTASIAVANLAEFLKNMKDNVQIEDNALKCELQAVYSVTLAKTCGLDTEQIETVESALAQLAQLADPSSMFSKAE